MSPEVGFRAVSRSMPGSRSPYAVTRALIQKLLPAAPGDGKWTRRVDSGPCEAGYALRLADMGECAGISAERDEFIMTAR